MSENSPLNKPGVQGHRFVHGTRYEDALVSSMMLSLYVPSTCPRCAYRKNILCGHNYSTYYFWMNSYLLHTAPSCCRMEGKQVHCSQHATSWATLNIVPAINSMHALVDTFVHCAPTCRVSRHEVAVVYSLVHPLGHVVLAGTSLMFSACLQRKAVIMLVIQGCSKELQCSWFYRWYRH